MNELERDANDHDQWQFYRAHFYAQRIERMQRELLAMTDLPSEEVEMIIGTLDFAARDLRAIAFPVICPRESTPRARGPLTHLTQTGSPPVDQVPRG